MEERNWERDSGENPMLAGLAGFESIFGVLNERWEIKICIGTIYTQTNQDLSTQRRWKYTRIVAYVTSMLNNHHLSICA
jgi:hypothetical protein